MSWIGGIGAGFEFIVVGRLGWGGGRGVGGWEGGGGGGWIGQGGGRGGGGVEREDEGLDGG